MNISASDIVLLAHAGFGVTGCLTALWVLVETLNARTGARLVSRIHTAALLTAFCMAGAWVCGGYWYVHFYPPEKDLILKGPWPLAHNFFMETKEHLFFITGILAFLLPVATREKLEFNAGARKLVLSVSALIVITGLAVEGAGAIVDHGVKIALLLAGRREIGNEAYSHDLGLRSGRRDCGFVQYRAGLCEGRVRPPKRFHAVAQRPSLNHSRFRRLSCFRRVRIDLHEFEGCGEDGLKPSDRGLHRCRGGRGAGACSLVRVCLNLT